MADGPERKYFWQKYPNTVVWTVVLALSLFWWHIASQNSPPRLVLFVATSLSSFMIGCLIGFLFTSYGEETGTVGKVRDWLIGGLTGLTIAKAGSIKDLLITFTASPNQSDFALTSSAAIVYAVLGFFFMFFQRELIFNVLLAKSRAERGKLEGSVQTGQVVQRLLVRLPLSVLSGIDYVDDLDEVKKEEVSALKDLLYSEDVKTFLAQADELQKGAA